MESSEQKEYAAFKEKVRRTLYLDNMSPNVNESVVRTAFDQYGTVKKVQFIPNYLQPNHPQCALVEMESKRQADVVISTISQFPFMMCGMPRPVRARAAEEEMFSDRPTKPGGNTHFRWLEPSDPDFEVAKKLKCVVKRHAAETAFVLKHQLETEEKLAKQQGDVLKVNHKKCEMLDGLMADGTAQRLAQHYNMRISENVGPSTFR